MVGLLVCWLVGWLADWLANWLGSWMASLLALFAQIALLRFDGFLGSLVGLLTRFELASPLRLIARIRMIIGLVHSLLSSISLLAYELTEILYSACLLARFLFLFGFTCFP